MESKYSKTLDELVEDVAFEAINSRDDFDSWYKAKAEAKAKLNDLLRRVEVDEAKWWSGKSVQLLKYALDKDPAFDYVNKEMADRIRELEQGDSDE